MNESPPETPINLSWTLKVFFVILIFFGLMAAFFWAHKPFDVARLAGLGQSILSLLFWLLILWLAAALGQLFLYRILANETPLTRLVMSAGVGMGVLSLIMLSLGLIGLIRAWVVVLLLVALALLARRQLRAILAEIRALRPPRPADRFESWLLLYGSVSLLLTLLIALAPVTAWDSLVYHLTGPRLYIEAARIVHPIDLPYLGFPLLGQMHFLLAMLLVGDGATAIFHFGYGLMALAVTVELSRRAFGRRAAWLAGTILLSIPTLYTLMRWPYVDITLMYYATAAFYAFYRWREHKEQTGWLVILGLFCGFAGGLKYTAVAIPIALGLSLIASSRRDGTIQIGRRVGIVALFAAVAVLPWTVENWLTTGNPVYPFFFDQALYWDEWRAWWYDRPGTGLATTAPFRLLLVPFEATILGTQGSEFYDATLGPLLLASSLGLVFIWASLKHAEKAIVGHMLLFFGLNYLLWLNGLARTALLFRARFLFFTFGLVAAMGGLALDRIRSLRRPILAVDWIVQVVVSLTLGLLLFTTVTEFVQINPLPNLLGLESDDRFLRRNLGVYQAVIADLNRLPSDARIQFLWEPRSYGCEVSCLPDALLDHFLHQTQFENRDAAEIARFWQEQGITHILLHQSGLEFIVAANFDPVGEQDLATWAALESDYLTAVDSWDGAYKLYRLES